MIRLTTHKAAVMLLVVTGLCPAADVYVRTDQQRGVGVLRSRSDGCFVIAPSHIFVSKTPAVEIISSQGRVADAVLEKRVPPDLAILRLSGVGQQFCLESSWPSDYHFNSSISVANIRGRSESGGKFQIEVSVDDVGDTYLSVSPRRPTDQLAQGMSGSTLEAGGRVVGILVGVEPPKGKVLRIDSVARAVEGFFVDNAACQPSCEIETSKLKNVERYDGSCPNPTGDSCAQTELVFALPADWPAPKFAHFVIQETRYNNNGKVFAFLYSAALSDSSGRRASGVLINLIGYQSSHTGQGSYSANGKFWAVEIAEGSQNDQFTIRVWQPFK